MKEDLKAKVPTGFINLSLSKENETVENVELVGNGVFKINNTTYPYTVDGVVDKIKLDNNTIMYSGPLTAIIKNSKNQDALVGINIDSKSLQGQISITIGPIDFEKGNGLLVFGSPDTQTIQTNQLRKDKVVETSNQISNNSPSSIMTPGSPFATTLSTTDYEYKDGTQTGAIGFNSTTNFGMSSYNTIILQAYGRDPKVQGNGSGSAVIRAFTNSPAVVDYMKNNDPYYVNPSAYTYSIKTFFHATNDNPIINIGNSGPADGSAPNTTKIAAYVPKVGSVLDFFLNNVMSWGSVSSDKVVIVLGVEQ